MAFDTAAEVALYIFLFFVALLSLMTVGLLAGLVFGIFKLNQKVDVALGAMRPLIDKSAEILESVERVTMNVGERADTILNQGEEMTANLARRVDRTATVVEKAVTSPLINASSVLAGLSRGLHAFNRGFKATNNSNNHSNGHK